MLRKALVLLALLGFVSAAYADYSGATLSSNRIITNTSGSSPAAGVLGQQISGSTPSGSATSLTTSTAANIPFAPLSLTAGAWACSGNIALTTGVGATMTDAEVWVSATSATGPIRGSLGYAYESGISIVSFSTLVLPTGTAFFNISTTTNIYFSAQAAFSGGAVTAYGSGACWRIG